MSFNDPQAVARYAEGPVRQVPGFAGLQRMAAILLAEHVPADGHVLVLGAGGGLELDAFADAQPGWRFTGVDPSTEMLDLARRVTRAHAARIDLHAGYIDTAPAGPFDGATCLLTLHFLPADARLETLQALRSRLVPGAPLVVAHHSVPRDEPGKSRWLGRYAAFAQASGVPVEHARRAPAPAGTRRGCRTAARRRLRRCRAVLRGLLVPRLGGADAVLTARVAGAAARSTHRAADAAAPSPGAAARGPAP